METDKIVIVIAGATGDLARRKLVPAFEILYTQGKLGSAPLIIGTGRSAITDEDFRKRFTMCESCAPVLHYHQFVKGIETYIASFGHYDRVLFFLALPPNAYAATAEEIYNEGFGKRVSLIIEKPFGHDVASAKMLNSDLARYFDESQLFRIDHYLAKEAAQNILVFRFANSIFYPVWNSRYIESIQINALEDIGIVERGAYFDKSGIIRDMVQNHLLQLICLLTMDTPLSMNPQDIRLQKIQILQSLHIDECHKFQYKGYRNEKGVDPESATETFAEVRLSIDNVTWKGTPIFLRTGKAVHRKGTEIGIRFRNIPELLFNKEGDLTPNRIIFKIQPAEGIILDIQSKVPGADNVIARSTMNFCYTTSFTNEILEAYQRLLYDVVRNDHTLFVSAAESEIAWEVIDPMLCHHETTLYEPGTLPQGKMQCDWINFDEYRNVCS